MTTESDFVSIGLEAARRILLPPLVIKRGHPHLPMNCSGSKRRATQISIHSPSSMTGIANNRPT